MEENLSEKTIEELEALIVEIDNKIKDLNDDIKFSEAALDDPTTPRNEYPELRGDIRYDNQQIDILENKKSEILGILGKKNVSRL